MNTLSYQSLQGVFVKSFGQKKSLVSYENVGAEALF